MGRYSLLRLAGRNSQKEDGDYVMLDEEGVEPEDNDIVEPAEELGDNEEGDAGDGEELPEDDDLPDDNEEGEGEPPARKESSAERRTRDLANKARKEREERIRLEAENKTLRESRTPTVDTSAEAARIRSEKLALMDPSERIIFEQQEAIKRLEQGQQLVNLQISDYADKARYDAKAMVNSVYAKHAEWVENQRLTLLKQGRNVDRETLLRLRIGDEALKQKPKPNLKRDKQEAAERVRTAKGAPVSARSDSGAKKTGKGDSLEELTERLRDVQL